MTAATATKQLQRFRGQVRPIQSSFIFIQFELDSFIPFRPFLVLSLMMTNVVVAAVVVLSYFCPFFVRHTFDVVEADSVHI